MRKVIIIILAILLSLGIGTILLVIASNFPSLSFILGEFAIISSGIIGTIASNLIERIGEEKYEKFSNKRNNW